MEAYFKKQLQIYDKLKIVYHSVSVNVNFSEKKNAYIKSFDGSPPSHGNTTLVTTYDKNKNATIIPVGARYNLICIDVDNKNKTLEFFFNLVKDNNYDLNTLTVNSINNGKHYYFSLTSSQKKLLENFKASNGKCFDNGIVCENNEHEICIDVKYNNQFIFGPSYFEVDNKILTYDIEKAIKPALLPDFLFNEILRVHTTTTTELTTVNTPNEENKKQLTKKVNNKTDTEDQQEITTKQNRHPQAKLSVDEINYKLSLYLDCLNIIHFDDRNDWLVIGSIIFNEGGSFDLFDKYSQKSTKYDQKGCLTTWKSYSENRQKKASLKKLIDMVEQDLMNHNSKIHQNSLLCNLQKAITNNCQYILTILFTEGVTDLTLSYLFYNRIQKEFIYDSDNKSWYCLNEYGIYELDKSGSSVMKIMSLALIPIITTEYNRLCDIHKNDKEQLLKYKSIYNKAKKYCSTQCHCQSLLQKLQLLYVVPNIYQLMDSVSPYLVGFTNGVYDLEKNEFRKAKPEEYVSVTTKYAYSKADPARKEEITNIIGSIFTDKEELKYILKYLSLGLVGNNKTEKFLIFLGQGSNGKSILSSLMASVLGDYYDPLDVTYLYKSNTIKTSAADPVMAKKKNTRLTFSTEPEHNQPLKSSTIKFLTGNDMIQTRNLYGSSFNFNPKFKLIIQTNTLPTFDGFDGGMIRRILLVKFTNIFVEHPTLPHERQIDMNLKEKINDKLYNTALFELLVEYYQLTKTEKFTIPPRFENDTADFLKDNDPIAAWIDVAILKTFSPKDIIQSSTMYENFCTYIGHHNIPNGQFKNKLTELGIKSIRKSSGIYFVGVKNNTEKEKDADFEND